LEVLWLSEEEVGPLLIRAVDWIGYLPSPISIIPSTEATSGPCTLLESIDSAGVKIANVPAGNLPKGLA